MRVLADEPPKRYALPRERISLLKFAQELWQSDPEVDAWIALKSEGEYRARALNVAWRRDELGKRAFYIKMAGRMLEARNYYR